MSELQQGFDPREAIELISICSALNGQSPDAPAPPLPANWDLSPAVESKLLDNAFQFGRSKDFSNRFVLAWRGTMTVLRSELEDFEFIPVEAQGFATDPRARLHSGFKAGFETLESQMVAELQKRIEQVPAGQPVDLIVTGHSQGGAVSALCAAYLRHAKFAGVERLRLKTYCFAQPLPGNYYFACDYNTARVAAECMTFVVNNNMDFVPQIPLTIQVPDDLNEGAHYVLGQHPPLWYKLLFDIKLPFTMDFRAAGAPVILPGHASDKVKTDFFYQHHAGRYWELLKEQFPDA